MKRTLISLVAVLVPVVAFGQIAPPITTNNTAIVPHIVPASTLPDTVTYRLWNGLIVIGANLGDDLPQSAVLHTGLPICLVTPAYAVHRSIQSEGLKDVSVMDDTVRMPGAKPQTFRVDKLSIENVESGVFDLYNYLSAVTKPDAPVMWIGNSALSAVTLTIDPRKLELTFAAPSPKMPAKAIVVPFELKDGRIWVDVKVNGKKTFSALLDTSAVGTLIPASVAKGLSLTSTTSLPVVNQKGKPSKINLVHLKELSIGSLKLDDVTALCAMEKEKDGIDPDLAIIGTDVLLRCKVTINYSQHKLALEKLPTTDAPKQSGEQEQKGFGNGRPNRPMGR